nr:Glycosyl transferase domain containing protein [Haemonchus contortus]
MATWHLSRGVRQVLSATSAKWMFSMLMLVALSVCCITYVLLTSQPEPGEALQETTTRNRDPTKSIVIYAATKFFRMDITTERFLSECHSTKGYCRITENKADLDVADAILFHNADYSPTFVPEPRKPSRPHVLWSLESPSNDYFRPGPHVINWTMTFRRDADIWYPYGHFRKLPEPRSVDFEAIWNMKNSNKTAVWLASNCFAKNYRTEIVKELVKHGLEIDRFGKCGLPPPGCEGVDKQGDRCVAELVRPYKFYVAFENSNCVDYVTEKFYETLISRMSVPIVLKRDIYINVGAPEKSFIALDDFQTIADMVSYIKEVSEDKEKYLGFHQWRTTHEAIPEHNDYTGFCELCRRLQQNSLGYMTYADVRKWHSDNQCDNNLGARYLN